MTTTEQAKQQIERAVRNATPADEYIKIIDVLDVTDIPQATFQAAITELYRAGWSVIPNSQGGDVSVAERRYCPMIGNQQVHLIKR